MFVWKELAILWMNTSVCMMCTRETSGYTSKSPALFLLVMGRVCLVFPDSGANSMVLGKNKYKPD